MFNYSINDTENALTIQFPLSRDKHKIDKKAASHTGSYPPQWSDQHRTLALVVWGVKK